jgi:hypothetical protein
MEKKSSQLLKEIYNKLDNFLLSKIKKGKFPLKNYYGEIFFAGAIKNNKIKKEILSYYKKRDKSDIDFHWEFNNYLLQQLGVSEEEYNYLYFNRPFYKKVTNWMFMRSLVYLRSKKTLKILQGHLIILLAIFLNQRKGILYDNRIYKRKEYSVQYHAFATLMLGEIFLETKNKFYKKRFESAIIQLKKMSKTIKKFSVGRGKGQIFGYAAAIYALSLGKKYLSINSKKEILILLKELKKYQRKDGFIPLCLTKEELGFKDEDYEKRGNKIKGWESYNRFYDYEAFLYYYLRKTLKIF